MIKLLKMISLIVLFFTLLLVFAPKQKIFNQLLYTLQDNKILLSQHNFNDELFSFNITNIMVLYKDIETISINKIKIKPYLLFNEIQITKIQIDDSLKQFLPASVDLVTIQHTIFDPLNLKIKMYSKLFKINGIYDILNKKIILNVNISKRFKTLYPKIIKKLKYDKTKKEYTYEYQL